MDLKQAKLILEKIHRLYETMTLDDKVDEFEQDLMLAYVKQLYDSFSPDQDAIPQPIKRNIPPQIPNSAKKDRDDISLKESPSQSGIPQESSKDTSPVIEETEIEIEMESFDNSETIQQKPSKANPNLNVPKMNKEVANLFEFERGKELSDKLGLQPIPDLTKAFGINEKILTVNELFGKDPIFYEEIMERLNRLPNFDEAKYVLAQIAEKHGWSDAIHKKKATIFIKKVFRRYL